MTDPALFGDTDLSSNDSFSLLKPQKMPPHTPTAPSFLRALLIDDPQPWRERRYHLTLLEIQKALTSMQCNQSKLSNEVGSSPSSLNLFVKKAIQSLFSSSFLSASLQYRAFQKNLRKALKTKTYRQAMKSELWKDEESGAIKVIHLLCRLLFTNVHLDTFCLETVELLEMAGLETKKSSSCSFVLNSQLPHPILAKDLLDSFPATHLAIRRAPLTMKKPLLYQLGQLMRSKFNFHFDPHSQENLPYVQYQVHLSSDNNAKKILALRMGSPTQEGWSIKARINPEFLGFIQSLATDGKKHVYFNLQHRTKRFFIGNEAPRSLAIETLQKEYPQTLLVVTIAKDSTFYHQMGYYAHMNHAEKFKEIFFHELWHEEGHYYFPPSLRTPNFQQKLLKLLSFVHTLYFDAQSELSRQQRCNFIEIFNLYLQQLCLIHLDADSFNITCRDGIDRAGASNALFYLFHLIQENKVNDPQFLMPLKAILFAPAIFVRQRAILPSRLHRFLTAAHHLLEHNSLKFSYFDI